MKHATRSSLDLAFGGNRETCQTRRTPSSLNCSSPFTKQAHPRSRCYSMQAGFGIVPRFFAAGSSDLGHARLVFKTRVDPTLNNIGLIRSQISNLQTDITLFF